MKINIKIKGSNTKNHAKPGDPPLHITLRTHVQNTIYNAFNINIIKTLETLQL